MRGTVVRRVKAREAGVVMLAHGELAVGCEEARKSMSPGRGDIGGFMRQWATPDHFRVAASGAGWRPDGAYLRTALVLSRGWRRGLT